MFEPFIAALGHEFGIRVVRYPTSGALGYEELEAHARAALPEEGPFVILGESFSGPIAVSIAASRPAGLIGLVLCATFAGNPRPVLGPLHHVAGALPIKLAPIAILSAALLGRFSTPPLQSALAAAISRVSSKALQARLRAVLSVDVSAKLKAVEVPLLYLWAKHDRVVPASAARRIKRALPSAQVMAVNAPHCLLQAAPDEGVALVGSFMRSLRAGLPASPPGS